MYGRTITHTDDGPVTLSLDTTAGPILVLVVQSGMPATVVLNEMTTGDEQARKIIDDATTTSSPGVLAVHLPRADGSFVSNTITSAIGNIVQAGDVSGSIVMGSGRMVVNGVDVTAQSHSVGNLAGGAVAVIAALPTGSSININTIASDLRTDGHLSAVSYRSMGGSIDVASTITLAAKTSGGDIYARRADNALVKSAGGDIGIGSTSAVDLSSSGGDITINRLAGDAAVRSSGGDITIHTVADSKITARASGGDVDVTADQGIRVDCDARSSGGRVRTPAR